MGAKSKARTIIVRLISTAQTGFFYTTQRVRQGPRLSAIKYDPTVRQRVLFVESSKRMLKNANWARYNLAVSLRKETEPGSSTMWNLPGDPMVDFHKFFDEDNITQQVLVAWINPWAEDSPNTKTTVATSSFMLTPVNYIDYDITMESKNAILLHSSKEQGPAYEFDDNGVQENFHCLPEAPPPLNILR